MPASSIPSCVPCGSHKKLQPMKISQLTLAFIFTLTLAAFSPLRAADIWHIKAVHPDGKLIDVKAIDKEGKIHPVKALVSDGNHHLLDVKALFGNSQLPIKVLPKASGDKYEPVKAIAKDGTIY